MSTVSFRLPGSMLKKIKELADREGMSVDQFLASAAAEKIEALTNGDLKRRAARGSREKLHRILDRVPHVPPDPGDEL